MKDEGTQEKYKSALLSIINGEESNDAAIKDLLLLLGECCVEISTYANYYNNQFDGQYVQEDLYETYLGLIGMHNAIIESQDTDFKPAEPTSLTEFRSESKS